MAPRAYALDIRGDRALALRALVGLSGPDAADRTTWIHVAYPGEWNGHPTGPFTLTRESFASCIREYEREANPLAVDYEHASLGGGEAPAAGWVQALEMRGEDLYARVELTERAAGYVRAGEYRYCSAVFLFDQPRRDTGEPVACALHSIALTNTPFIDGQRPIALSRAASVALGATMTKDQIKAALDQIEGDELTEEQAQALLASVQAMAIAQGEYEEPEVEVEPAPMATMPEGEADPEEEPAALADVPPPEETTQETDAMQMAFARLTEATGLDSAALLSALDANLDAVASALRGNVGAEAASLSHEAMATSLREAQRELSRYRAEDEKRRKAETAVALSKAVDALVSDGRALPSQREDFARIASELGDVEKFVALTKTLPVVVPQGKTIAASTPAPSASQTTEPVFATGEEAEIAKRYRDSWGVRDPKKLARLVARHIDMTKASAS